MMPREIDVLIVGCGFAGSTAARAFADAGLSVLVIDKRPHSGGNAYDHFDAQGVLVHKYGPHIFHTNSEKIIRWLSRFTEWRFYEHRVLAFVDGNHYPMPINRTTINKLYGWELDEHGVEEYLKSIREARAEKLTSEDVVLGSVGRDLCEKFFRGYTRKQWGLDLSELSAGVASRIPTRVNDDDRYFSDTYQLMPLNGYSAMFERMLNHPCIHVRLNTQFRDINAQVSRKLTLYTGPIDEYYDFRFGRLPYRSLRFEREYFADKEQYQSVGTINYPNDHDFTRITEFKHLTGQRCIGTSIVREFPMCEGDPYYPIPRPENERLLKRYRDLADQDEGVTFVGRLAEYRYYNMDQVLGAALATADRLVRRLA